MAATQWPAVVTALLAVLDADPTLTGRVFDGIPVSYDTVDGVFVGVQLSDDGDAGTFTETVHELGGAPPLDEVGVVRCSVLAQRGDTDLAASRATVFGLFAAVESVIRANHTLGLPVLLDVDVSAGTVRAGQTKHGAYAELLWQLRYRALI